MPGRSSQDVGQPGFLPPWDGASYAANTAHHRRYDEAFLASIPLRPTDRVLDVGCGSGDLTSKLAALVPDGSVVGLDAQPSMVEEARTRARANQRFVVTPAQQLAAAVGPQRFDVVVSQSVLHWLPWPDHAVVVDQCRAVLRPGGALRIECGGGDNVTDVADLLGEIALVYGHTGAVPWTFTGAGAYLDLLVEHGFNVDGGWVRTIAQRRPFDESTVRGWLHSQVLQAYEAGIDPARHAAFRADVDRRLGELRRPDGSYDRTFVRLDLLAFAPQGSGVNEAGG